MIFTQIDTEVIITNPVKSPANQVNMTLDLNWFVEAPDSKTPTGIISLTSGSKTCALDIGSNPVRFTNCEGNVTVSIDNRKLTYTISGLAMTSQSGTNIKAEYAGDGLFLKSNTDAVDFNKLNTTLVINKAYKSGGNLLATVLADLSWNKDEAAGKEPTGTLTFTIGADSCVYDIAGGNFTSCNGESTLPTVVDGPDQDSYIGTFERMLLSQNNTSDRVKVQYSGDSVFNASSSDIVLFQTIPTTLEISGQSKKTGGLVDLTAVLTWNEEPITGVDPTGVIKLTMGTATCSLNVEGLEPVFTDCDGKVSKASDTHRDETAGTFRKTWTFTITDLKMGDGTGDSIKAEYPGDGYYLASASAAKSFKKYDTKLDIEKAYKSGSYADLNTLLSWNKTDAGNKVPTGTITLTIGGDSCKLTFDGTPDDGHVKDFTCFEKDTTVITPSSVSPVPTPDMKIITWKMVKILLSSGSTADRVKAEYSGDANFNPSTSEFVLFESIPTELKISKMYTTSRDSSNLHMEMELSWTKAPTESGKTPTGMINLTVGDTVCTLDTTKDPLAFTNCTADSITPGVDGKKMTFTIENLAAGDLSKNSVSAEYSGDSLFQASKYEHKVDTETVIDSAYINPDGTVKLVILQKWDQDLAGKLESKNDKAFRPSGTMKITVGSSTCTLQLNGRADPTLTDCDTSEASLTYPSETPKYNKFQILGLKIGDGTAASVKVEYSGDSLFNKSDVEKAFKTRDTELKLDNDQTNKTNDNRVNLVATLTWDATGLSDEIIPVGPVTFTIGSDSCKLDLTNGSFSCTDSSTVVTIFDVDGNPVIGAARVDGGKRYRDWTLKLDNIKLSDSNDPDRVKGDFAGDKLFNPSSSETKYFAKTDTEITVADAYKSGNIRANWTSVLSWDPAVAGTDIPGGVITFAVGSDSCKLTLDPVPVGGDTTNPKKQTNFTCADSATEVLLTQVDGKYTLTFTDVLLTEGNNADRIKADYAGDGLFNASSGDYVLFDTVPTTTNLLNQEKNPSGLVSALVELSWTKDPMSGGYPQGTIKLTSGSASCTLDLGAEPVRFKDCGNLQPVVTREDKHWTIQIRNLNMGSGVGEDLIAEYSGFGSYLPSASIKKSFTKVNTALVINNAYKPNDPNYANLLSVFSWNKEKAAGRVPTGTIKYTVGGGSCELNLSTKKLSCESASDPIRMEGIDIDFDNAGYRVVIEKMLLADSSADRVTAEYSGDAVFNSSTASAKLFKKLDTAIDITNAYRDKNSGRASVYVRMDWDEAEDEGLKPTGSLKFNLGSGSCTMDLKTKKLSCVGDTMGTISADGHDYGASNMLLTDMDAKIVSVEYSGDAFFNPSVSQQKLFSGLKTTIAVTAASKGCDGENHCFINLSGTLDWEEDVSVIDLPTGKLIIKVGNQSIVFDMDYREKGTDPFTGVVPGKHEEGGTDYTQIANQVKSYDSANRHTFEFKNLLLDDVADVNDITVEYSGDENYGYSTGEGPISKITIDTKIDLRINDFSENFQGSGHPSWRLRGAITSAYYELPFELTPSGTFTMEGYYEDDISHDVNRSFFKDDFQIGGPAYDLVDDFEITLNWVVKQYGRYELKFNTGLTGCHEGDLRWVSIKYNGDDSTKSGQLYTSSNKAYYYASARKTLGIRIQKYVEFSVEKDKVFMDTTGRKYFNLEVGEKLDNGLTRASNLAGTWTFVTDSGICSVKSVKVPGPYSSFDYYYFTQDEGECSILYTAYDDTDIRQSYIASAGSGQYNILNMYALNLGNSSDTFLDVYFSGNDTYKPVNIKLSPFGKTSTSLSFVSKEISNNKLNLTARINVTGVFPASGSTNITAAYPAGKFIIQAGDSYTCTVNISKNNPFDEIGKEASLGDDCGGGEIELVNTPGSNGRGYMEIRAKYLPIPDPSIDKVKIEYKGDTIYQPSGPVEESFSRTDTSLTLAHTESVPNEIETTIRPTEFSYGKGQLTGTITYTFSPSGTTCTLAVESSRRVTVIDCDGGSVSNTHYDSSYGTLEFTLTKNNISQTDMEVSAVYSGDGKYSSSSGSTSLRRYDLTLIPVTAGLDSSGRLYFNTQEVPSVPYPKYPERDSYSYCQDYPGDTTNCRLLEHEFTLTVRIETPSGASTIPTGTKLQFAGDFSGSESKKCPITPVSSGVYSCSLENVYFTTPGEKKISVTYPESDLFNEASAEFPTMYAVSVSPSGLAETTTVITEPETLTAGTTVTVKAETKSASDPNKKPEQQIHLFYTYNFSTKERVQTCMETSSGAGCKLTLTNDTDWVYAEFLGYDNYAASIGSKEVTGASSSEGSPVSFGTPVIGGN